MERFVVTGEDPYLNLTTHDSLFEAMQWCIVRIMENDEIDKPILVELSGGPTVYLLHHDQHVDWIQLEVAHAT
jgi:hypothetical protein